MTLAQKAYDALRRDIVSGKLTPGQRLRLDALRHRYGMGFSPLREALNRLQGERLVVAEALKGFAVAPLSLAEMWDVIETRIVIETQALSRSIRVGTDAWEAEIVARLHSLTRLAQRLSAADAAGPDELDALESRHKAFHRALIAGCRSIWLMDFADKLYVSSERYRYPALSDNCGRSDRDVLKEHAALADAAIARNEREARTLLEEHYRRTGDEVEARFSRLVANEEAPGKGTPRTAAHPSLCDGLPAQ